MAIFNSYVSLPEGNYEKVEISSASIDLQPTHNVLISNFWGFLGYTFRTSAKEHLMLGSLFLWYPPGKMSKLYQELHFPAGLPFLAVRLLASILIQLRRS